MPLGINPEIKGKLAANQIMASMAADHEKLIFNFPLVSIFGTHIGKQELSKPAIRPKRTAFDGGWLIIFGGVFEIKTYS